MWNLRTCLLLQLTTILWHLCYNHASAQASGYLCQPPCVESFDESCEELLTLYDWSGDCCSLADNGDTGGCNLTTVGSCTNSGHMYPVYIEMSEDPCNPYYISLLGGFVNTRSAVNRSAEETEGMACPVSAYQPFEVERSQNEFAVFQMTLSGLSSPLTYEEAMEWRTITEQHLLDTYEEENLNLMTSISIPGEDYFPVNNDGTGNITITYVQIVSWREPTNTSNLDAVTFINRAYGDTSAVSSYLSKLQDEEAFVSVTAVSLTTIGIGFDSMIACNETTTEETTTPAAEGMSTSTETTAEETPSSSTTCFLGASSVMAVFIVWFGILFS